ncbi:MAG: hypothetical protein J3R72DRAFT_510146 [Linnemannia gamsii]|nr:MAG: hypothetical protein J3R72DRAFT_510146 [Linnemannia gamsii]
MVGIEVVLDRILTLKRYAKLSDPIATLSLLHAQTTLQLTQVELKARLTCWEFFNFLRNAPNLDYLRILEIAHVNNQQPCSQEEAALLMGNTPSRLTSIQLEFMSDGDAALQNIILPWIPSLQNIYLTQLFPKIATTLSALGSALTTIEDDSTGPIIQTVPGRWRPDPQAGSLEIMTDTCLSLDKIDWIGHTLYDTNIWTTMEDCP